MGGGQEMYPLALILFRLQANFIKSLYFEWLATHMQLFIPQMCVYVGYIRKYMGKHLMWDICLYLDKIFFICLNVKFNFLLTM